MRQFTLLWAMTALVASSGCLQYASLLEINPDGSGTLTVRELMSQEGRNFLNLGGSKKEKPEAKEDIEKIRLRHTAATETLGSDVIVKDQQVISKKGWHGIQTTYAFPDINKLSLHTVPSKDGDDEESSEQTPAPFSFSFSPGKINRLRIQSQSDSAVEEESDDPFAAAGIELKQAPKSNLDIGGAIALQIAKAGLRGARVSCLVKVNGNVQSVKGAVQSAPNTFMILDFDLEEFANSDQFQKAAQEEWDFDRMLKEKIPGLSGMPSGSTIEIDFTSNE